jgi:hypothetical protein
MWWRGLPMMDERSDDGGRCLALSRDGVRCELPRDHESLHGAVVAGVGYAWSDSPPHGEDANPQDGPDSN